MINVVFGGRGSTTWNNVKVHSTIIVIDVSAQRPSDFKGVHAYHNGSSWTTPVCIQNGTLGVKLGNDRVFPMSVCQNDLTANC
jgi:hypothetical protein